MKLGWFAAVAAGTCFACAGSVSARREDAGTGKLVRTFEGHTGDVTSVAFSPDGTRLLSGSGDKTKTGFAGLFQKFPTRPQGR